MRKIYVAKNPADAQLLAALLEGEGIHTKVLGEFLYGTRDNLPTPDAFLPTVWVMYDSDFEKAEEIIKQYNLTEEAGVETGKEWKCNGCGETNEGVFTECWKCGRSRPS